MSACCLISGSCACRLAVPGCFSRSFEHVSARQELWLSTLLTLASRKSLSYLLCAAAPARKAANARLPCRRPMRTASLPRAANPVQPALRPSLSRCPRKAPSVAVRAINDTNFFLNVLESATACTVAAGVAYATTENKDKQLEDLQKLEIPVVGPLAAAVAADAIAHSIPGLNVLFALLAEPSGAAAGVAYMMSIVLSSQSVDPKTLAPEGTVLNAEKAMDSRAALRVPFTQIIPTALKVVDMENEASSGAGWKIGENGLPKLPINSVLIVLGVGGTILEAASHAPVLGLFMPRVLQVAGWLAAAGYGFEVLGLNNKK